MSLLDDVCTVNITVADSAPSQAGFGTPNIIDYHTAWLDRLVQTYSKPSAMLEDGFTVVDYAYKAASAMWSQSPHPKTFKVGRLQHAYTQIIHLIPTSTTVGKVYSGTINGQAFTYTVQSGDNIQAIVEALQPTINALTGVSCTEDNTKLVVTTDTAGKTLEYKDLSSIFKVFDATQDPGIAADLAAIEEEDSDWYGAVLGPNGQAIVEAAAAWFEANVRKILVVQSADWNIIDNAQTTDLASNLKANGYARTIGIWHPQIGTVTGSAAAAWLSGRLTTTPGEDTWAFKTLAGITVYKLTDGANTALENKFWSRYVQLSGLPSTFEGKSGAGDYADVTRGVDWLFARIRERFVFIVKNVPKVPYTDAGIDTIVGGVQVILNQGVANGFLANDPAPNCTAPKALEQDSIDRINRVLRNVEFTARLAGAIHRVEISGTISV